MKSTLFAISMLICGLTFGQTLPEKKEDNKSKFKKENIKTGKPSTKLTQKEPNIFYKNVDSTKASQYKMLTKQPKHEGYSELSRTTTPKTAMKKKILDTLKTQKKSIK